MPTLLSNPTLIQAPGNKPKAIAEFVGRPSTSETKLSIALMNSPAGWAEAAQSAEYREYALVVEGVLRVESEAGILDVRAGQAVIIEPGDRVRYSTPEGAKYVSVCLPAFSIDLVHR